MKDYNKIVACMRECFGWGTTCNCDICAYNDKIIKNEDGSFNYTECEAVLFHDAANAIEELQIYVDIYKDLADKGMELSQKALDICMKAVKEEI